MQLILFGAGAMGAAMLDGWSEHDVTVVTKDSDAAGKITESHPFVHASVYNKNGVSVNDKIVVLAVKPQVFPTLQLTGTASGVISVMAGVKLSSIKEKIDAKQFVRAMPNLAAKKALSMTTVTGDAVFRHEACKLLESIGETLWVESEKELDIATAVAGSGPAYLALVAEALADGAVRLGLKRHDAYRLAGGVIKGTGVLLENSTPSQLKDAVMSPAGTTAAGYAALENAGVRAAFIECVKAAFDRAQELGAK